MLNVSPGRRGRASGSDTSTLAIYDDVHKKTVVYVHTAPAPGLRAGQRVTKGQRVGTEDYRGVSSSGSAHTHIEVRNGAQRLAARSVGDETLRIVVLDVLATFARPATAAVAGEQEGGHGTPRGVRHPEPVRDDLPCGGKHVDPA